MKLKVELVIALVLGSLFAMSLPALADSYTGYITDTKCYVGMDKGPMDAAHAACARSCIKTGAPAALRTEDGKLYILAPEGDPQNLMGFNTMLSKYAGKKVKINGKLTEKEGVTMVFVHGKVTLAK